MMNLTKRMKFMQREKLVHLFYRGLATIYIYIYIYIYMLYMDQYIVIRTQFAYVNANCMKYK